MKKFPVIAVVVICLLNVAGMFQNFNFVSAEDFKQWTESDKPMIIVDIQPKEEFAAHHFAGSVETNAFPVKSDEEKQRIDPAVAAYKATGHDVVVICPRGGGGAKRCYNYLQSQGVPEEKLFILEGGIAKWPYPAMFTVNKE